MIQLLLHREISSDCITDDASGNVCGQEILSASSGTVHDFFMMASIGIDYVFRSPGAPVGKRRIRREVGSLFGDDFVGPLDAGYQGGGAADGGLEAGEVVVRDAARDAAGVADFDRHAEVDALLPLFG